MMKIAVYHNLPSGGAKRVLFETLRRLSEEHVIDVFTLSTADHDFCDIRPFARRHKVFEFQPLPLYKSPWGRINQLQRYRDLKRLDVLAQQVVREIEKDSYDIVYVYPSIWTNAPPELRYLQTPSVYHIQEPLRSVYEVRVPRPYQNFGWRDRLDLVDPLIKLYRNRLIDVDKQSTWKASCLLVNSRFTSENVRQIYGRESEVAYYGIDTTAFKPLKDIKKEDFVLSVGALLPNKGFDFLILALSKIPEVQRPPLRIIGNSSIAEEKLYLEESAKRLGVQLIIETMVDQDTLLKRYNQASVFVYSPIREPLGLAPLEAMACGTPVVGVAEGGVRETILDEINGYLSPREPQAFAEKVMALLSEPEKRRKMGEEGRQFVLTHWNWDVAVERIEKYMAQTTSIV